MSQANYIDQAQKLPLSVSKPMQLLVTDLSRLRNAENSESIDRFIEAARTNRFDDLLHPYDIPSVDLLLIARKLQLTEIVQNTLAGKYDAL
jgi:hypothetical protein